MPTDSPVLLAQVPEKSKHYGLTSLLPQPLKPSEGLVLQYEVKFADGHTCGGGYLKLLTHKDGFRASQLKDDTPYSVMFGPDKCGAAGKVSSSSSSRCPSRSCEHARACLWLQTHTANIPLGYRHGLLASMLVLLGCCTYPW